MAVIFQRQNDLRKLDKESTIANTAGRWGFWHMGQFAADYRRMFGELPSETIQHKFP